MVIFRLLICNGYSFISSRIDTMLLQLLHFGARILYKNALDLGEDKTILKLGAQRSNLSV